MAASIATTSFGSDLGTEIVSIYVGPESKQFVVHKLLLTSQSEYFQKALNGGFKEAEENKIHMEEEDPAAIELLTAFLYLGIIPRPGAVKAPSKPLPALLPSGPAATYTSPSTTIQTQPIVCGGTAFPFRPLDVREPNDPTMVNRHLHICHDVAYRHLSPEEIRLADYHSGRKYGGRYAIAQLHLPPAIALQDAPAIYQLQLPPPTSSRGSDTRSNFRGTLLGSTASKSPAGSQLSSSFGGAPISSPTGSSALFGQASSLTNPLSRASPSPWGAGNTSFANPPSTPVSSAAAQKSPNVTPQPQQLAVSATVPKAQSLSTPSSSSAPATPGATHTVNTSASGLTGFAKYANQPHTASTPRPPTDGKSVLTGASVLGSSAAQSDKASTPKPSELTGFANNATQSENASPPKPGTTGTSVFGSPATKSTDAPAPKPNTTVTSVFGSRAAQAPGASTPTPVLSIFNQSQSRLKLKTPTPSSTGSSLSMNVPSSSGSLTRGLPNFRTMNSSSAPPSQNIAPSLGGFGSNLTVTNPKPEESSLEAISKSGKIRDLVEEEVAHQEALLNLCILAETICWPKLFNAAIDAYVQGERSLRRDILVSHIDVIYERTHYNSPLRDFVLDAMRGLNDGAITLKEYMGLAYAHEDFLEGVISRLSTSNADKTAAVFGSKPKEYHMTENTSRVGASRHESIIKTTTTSRAKLTMTLSEFRATYLSQSGKPFDKIVVGAIISKDGGQRILLLRRAEHETYYTNVFELPSGKVEDTDATLGAALRREVAEETGLGITSVVSEMQPIEYVTSETVEGVAVCQTCLQLNFIVNVGDYEVKIDPAEHSVAVWADVVDLTRLEITDEMRSLVGSAFAELKKKK